jgi:OOP family OmpA-OmpF porin
MNPVSKSIQALGTTAALIALVSCSHAPVVQEFPDTASPSEEATRFEEQLSDALRQQVNVLSPENYAEAQDSLSQAKRQIEKQKDAKDSLHSIAEGQAYLKRANAFAELARSNIQEVVAARSLALQANAPVLFPNDFRDVDARLKTATRAIEKNDLENAIKNRSAIQLQYMDVELRSIKQARLGSARDTLALSIKEGARKLAPRTLAQTEKVIQDSDAFITANRHDRAALQAREASAIASADHLLKITRDAKAGKKTSSEDLALRMDSDQTKALEQESLLNRKDTQLKGGRAQLLNKETEIQSLNQEKSALTSEQEVNRLYETARAEFTANEAEVYKQGKVLMIRLRGLEFPVSQAALQGSNFPLLAKVQKVIHDFGNGPVTVEGHTDSMGSKELNERLSSERASAVKEYFLSNAQGQPMNITAVGFGFQKPLATNKTAEGRAQNRRVDVLIRPQSL